MFNDARAHLRLILNFAAISEPVDSERGLESVLRWLDELAKRVNINGRDVEMVRLCLTDPRTFQHVLEAVRNALGTLGKPPSDEATQRALFAANLALLVTELRTFILPTRGN